VYAGKKFYAAARKTCLCIFLGNLQLPLNSAESEAPGRQFEKSADIVYAMTIRATGRGALIFFAENGAPSGGH
jgi:hypothetical protein